MRASPAELLLKRVLHTKMDLTRPPTSSQIMHGSQQEQAQRRSTTPRSFHLGDHVLSRNYLGGPMWVAAVAITGSLSYQVCNSDDVVVVSYWPATGQQESHDGADRPPCTWHLKSYGPFLKTQLHPSKTTVWTGFPRPSWCQNQHRHHPPWRTIPAGTPLANDGLQIALAYNPSAGMSYPFCAECNVNICSIVLALQNKGQGFESLPSGVLSWALLGHCNPLPQLVDVLYTSLVESKVI